MGTLIPNMTRLAVTTVLASAVFVGWTVGQVMAMRRSLRQQLDLFNRLTKLRGPFLEGSVRQIRRILNDAVTTGGTPVWAELEEESDEEQ